MPRCPWAEVSDLDRLYHDTEWGVPVRDDRQLFEMLTLEGAQAGLSWTTILAKREGYRRCFLGFDAERVARFTPAQVDRLMRDSSIVRHRGKIESTVTNAKAVIALHEAGESLADLLWSFVDGVPLQNRPGAAAAVPSQTPVSLAMSKQLKRQGFRFVGPTTCYALMQAAGLVNDHLVGCPRHAAVQT